MFTSHSRRIAAALTALLAAAPVLAAPADKPVASQQERFPNGYWSVLPRATFRTGDDYQLEFPIQAGVIPWLRLRSP